MVINTEVKINGTKTLVDTCNVIKSLGDVDTSSEFEATINNYRGDKSTDFVIGDEVVIYADKNNLIRNVGSPTVWYTLNTSGTFVYDVIGGVAGSCISGVSFSDGKIGSSALFDGLTGQIKLDNSIGSMVAPYAGSFALSLWFNYAGSSLGPSGGNACLIGGQYSSNFILLINSNKTFTLREDDNGVTSSIQSIPSGTWGHFVLNHNLSTGSPYYHFYDMYYNNSLIKTGSFLNITGNPTTQDQLYIGWENRSKLGFNGKIDDVRIYSGCNLTSDQVGNIYNQGYGTETIESDSQKIFTGVLEEISLEGEELEESLILSGRDYSARLMDRTVEPETYNNMLAGDIVKDIISKYVDGITTTNVSNGTLISRIVFNQTPVFDAIKQLAGVCNFMFYIDNNKDLHFESPGTTSSGYAFDNTNILNTSFKERRDTLYNEVWVYGDRYLDAYKETLTAGSPVGGSIFNLLYKPHNTSVTVTGATIQPGGIYQMSVGSDVKYLVNFDDKQIIFTSGTSQGENIPTSGNSVVVNYQRDLPIVKVGENDNSINQYGRRVKVINDTNIKDPLTAEMIMLKELDEFSDPTKEGNLQLNNINALNPGETCVVNIPIYGINNTTYKILETQYDFNKETELNGNVLKIKVNKKLPNITDTLKDILLQLKKLQSVDISDSDLLTRYKWTTGSLGIRQSGVEVYISHITGSCYHVYATDFIPSINPFHCASGTNQGYCAGSWTGSASAFSPMTLYWSGGYF